jgi:hypothetical protein
MASFYSIVQYIPDLIRDERINIGLVVYDQTKAKSHFLKDWKRVRDFGGYIPALKKVGDQIGGMSLDALKKAIASWDQSIRFTNPAPSLLDAETLLHDMSQQCLVEPAPRKRGRGALATKSNRTTR